MAFAVSGAGGGGGSVVPFPSVTSNVPSTAPSQPLVHTGDMGTSPQSPMYDGPPINSIQHTAESLGAPYHTDTATGLTTVNGNTIKPTSFQNGVPHGPVRDVAIAAGYPAAHIQTSGNSGNVTVMPKPPAPPDQALVHPGNMGLPTITSPTAAQPYTPPVVGQPASTSPAQALVHTGNMGVPNPQPVAPNQALVHPGNMAPPPAAGVSVPQVSNMSAGATQAPTQAPASPTAVPAGYNTGNPQLDQALSLVTQWIQNQSANPYQYQLPTQPQYNFDMGQAAQQAFNTENPIYQSQIATADQRINDQMNRRGIYTSGIAQQAVDSQNAALYQNMDNAIQKDITAQQNSYNTGYNDQMNGWRDNVNAMYQQGQINDTQARNMLTAINDVATQLNKQGATQAGLTKAEIPYTQGATPQQLTVDALNSTKLQLDAAYKNGQLTEAQYRDETTRINDAMKNAVAQQNANTNSQKANTTAQNDQAKLQLAKDKQTFDEQTQNAKLDLATKTLAEKIWQTTLTYTTLSAKDRASLAINEAKVAIQQQNANTNASKAKTSATQGQEKINISQQNANTSQARTHAEVTHWANQDQAAQTRLSIQQGTLNEKIKDDNAKISQAQQRITDTQAKQAITGYHDQLTSLSGMLTAGSINPNTVDPSAAAKFGASAKGMTYADEYSYLMANITNVIAHQSSSGTTTAKGSAASTGKSSTSSGKASASSSKPASSNGGKKGGK